MNINDLFMVPYKEGGRDPSGYDCFGFFQEICRRRGIHIPEQDVPAFTPIGKARHNEMCEIIADSLTKGWKEIDKPEPWCAVAIRIGGWISHMGIVMDDCVTFIHMNEHTGVNIQRLDSPMWAKRIVGFYVYV